MLHQREKKQSPTANKALDGQDLIQKVKQQKHQSFFLKIFMLIFIYPFKQNFLTKNHVNLTISEVSHMKIAFRSEKIAAKVYGYFIHQKV